MADPSQRRSQGLAQDPLPDVKPRPGLPSRGRQRDRYLVAAVLIVTRRPFEPAGLRVQRGAAGQPGRGVRELDGRAVGLFESARHAAGKLQRVMVALAQRLLRKRGAVASDTTIWYYEIDEA